MMSDDVRKNIHFYREWLRRHPAGVFEFHPTRGHAFSSLMEDGVWSGSGPICGAAPGPLDQAPRCADCEKVIEAIDGKIRGAS